MAEDTVILQMDNGEAIFDGNIILVTYQAKEGQHIASNGGMVVCLDLTITDELKEEGFARDIVRNIQDARKQIGCEITDKISLAFEGNVPEKWLEYICKETLGQLRDIPVPESVIEIEAEGEKKVKVFVSKAL